MPPGGRPVALEQQANMMMGNGMAVPVNIQSMGLGVPLDQLMGAMGMPMGGMQPGQPGQPAMVQTTTVQLDLGQGAAGGLTVCYLDFNVIAGLA